MNIHYLYKYLRLVGMALWCVLLLAACSTDDDKTGNPVFPEPVALQAHPVNGKPATANFSFTVDRRWALNSDKIWCQFKEGDAVVRTTEGDGGEQKTVTVYVTGDAQNFSDATANIEMTMDGETKTVATVNRSAKGYEVKMYGATENDTIDATHPFKLTYGDNGTISSATVHIVANFDWTIDRTRVPEWLDIPADQMTGLAGKVVSFTAEFSDSASKVMPDTAFFYVMDQAGVEHSKAQSLYSGMPDTAVEFGIDNPWGWNVDKDGYTIWQTNSTEGGKNNEQDLPLNFTVSSRAKVKPVYLEEDKEYGGYTVIQTYPGMEPPWFSVLTDDDGYVQLIQGDKASFSVDKNDGAARGGILALLPEKVYEDTYQGTGILDENTFDLKPEYEKYVVVSFTQEGSAVSNSGFSILDGMSMTPYDGIVSALDQGIDAETLKGMYGTDNVWIWNPESEIGSAFITANGYKGGANGETDYTFDNYQSGESTAWPGIEPSNMGYPSQFSLYIGFDWAQVPVNKPMEITFKGTNGMPYAVLVITRYSARYRLARRAARIKAKMAAQKAGLYKVNKKGARK